MRRGAWTGLVFGSAFRRTNWQAWGRRGRARRRGIGLPAVWRLPGPHGGLDASRDRAAGGLVAGRPRAGPLQPLRRRLVPEPPARLSGRQPPLRPRAAAARAGQRRRAARPARRPLPRRGPSGRSRIRRGAQVVSGRRPRAPDRPAAGAPCSPPRADTRSRGATGRGARARTPCRSPSSRRSRRRGRPLAALRAGGLRRRRAARTRCRRTAGPRRTSSSRACTRGSGRTGASRRAG